MEDQRISNDQVAVGRVRQVISLEAMAIHSVVMMAEDTQTSRWPEELCPSGGSWRVRTSAACFAPIFRVKICAVFTGSLKGVSRA